MESNIREVVSYKTNDDVVFEKKNDAIKHADRLIEEKELANLIQQVTKLFKSSMDRYKDAKYDKDYELWGLEAITEFPERG